MCVYQLGMSITSARKTDHKWHRLYLLRLREMVDMYCTLPFLHSYFTFSILVSFSITFGIVLLFFLFCFSLDLSCILSLLYLFCISSAPLLFQSLYAGKAASYNFVFLCSATAQNHRSIALSIIDANGRSSVHFLRKSLTWMRAPSTLRECCIPRSLPQQSCLQRCWLVPVAATNQQEVSSCSSA